MYDNFISNFWKLIFFKRLLPSYFTQYGKSENWTTFSFSVNTWNITISFDLKQILTWSLMRSKKCAMRISTYFKSFLTYDSSIFYSL